MTHSYHIEGMTCNSCLARVKSELLKLRGIDSVEIQLQSPQATISMSHHISEKELQAGVSKAGSYIIKSLDQTGLSSTVEKEQTRGSGYFPVVLIFGYISLITVFIQVVRGSFSWMQWMSHFMAGFFIVFSFFKFLDLKGFATGYRNYDLIARHIPAWGFIYPFIELGLGLALLFNSENRVTMVMSLIIMTIGALGVTISLLKKEKFRCACLGTTIAIPLGKLALFENILMVTMSILMLVIMN